MMGKTSELSQDPWNFIVAKMLLALAQRNITEDPSEHHWDHNPEVERTSFYDKLTTTTTLLLARFQTEE